VSAEPQVLTRDAPGSFRTIPEHSTQSRNVPWDLNAHPIHWAFSDSICREVEVKELEKSRFELQPRQPPEVLPRPMLLLFGICACLALMTISASTLLAPNQTNGFGNNRLVTFTYLQNFDCVDQPLLDLNFQSHSCAIGSQRNAGRDLPTRN